MAESANPDISGAGDIRPDEIADLPERTCIVTRIAGDERTLLRFARAPDGLIVPDLARRLPGRGAWVTLSAETVRLAQRRNLFARAFRAECRMPADLALVTEGLLRQAAVSYIALCRKAGVAVAGFTRVEEVLRTGKARILLHAPEARADGCRKLDGLATPGVLISRFVTSDEMDLAFSRTNVIHCAIAQSGIAEKLRDAIARCEAYSATQDPIQDGIHDGQD